MVTAVPGLKPVWHILPRQEECSEPGLKICDVDGHLKFCCPQETECVPVNNNTSAICCHKGRNCNSVKQISCNRNDIGGGGVGVRCGTGECCPSGFQCQDSVCVMQESLLRENGGAPARGHGDLCKCPKFPAAGVLSGFFPGLFLGIGLVLIIIHFRRSVKKRHTRSIKSFICPIPDTSSNQGHSLVFHQSVISGERMSIAQTSNDTAPGSRALFSQDTGHRSKATSRIATMASHVSTIRNTEGRYINSSQYVPSYYRSEPGASPGRPTDGSFF